MKLHPMFSHPQIDLLPEPGQPVNEVRAQVWGLLSTMYPRAGVTERRREARYPFPVLLNLMPVAEDDTTPCGEIIVVAGKHISAKGLGFYHPKPLPYRRVIASLEGPRGEWFGFLMDLSWCRFTRKGWYESGGRFLEAVTSPIDRTK